MKNHNSYESLRKRNGGKHWVSSVIVRQGLSLSPILCCSVLYVSPNLASSHLPKTTLLDSFLLCFPFPVLGLVRIACSDQFVQFYNRTQPGRLADAQRLQKKLKEGIVGKKKVSALHQPKKVNECKMSTLTHVCCTYITSAVGTYTCKLFVHPPWCSLTHVGLQSKQ